MYKRIVLKLSGETLAPEKIPADKGASLTFDAARVDRAAAAIVKLHDLGVQVGVVMGGGNIWRGRFTDAMNPVQADQMGMLATIINALAVQDAILRLGRAIHARSLEGEGCALVRRYLLRRKGFAAELQNDALIHEHSAFLMEFVRKKGTL